MLLDASDHFIPCLLCGIIFLRSIERKIFLWLNRMKKTCYFQPQGRLFVSVFVLEPIKGRADVWEESSQR